MRRYPETEHERRLDLTVLGLTGQVIMRSVGREPYFYPSTCSCTRSEWSGGGETIAHYVLCGNCGKPYGWSCDKGVSLSYPKGRDFARLLLEEQGRYVGLDDLTGTIAAATFVDLGRSFFRKVRGAKITDPQTVWVFETLPTD